MKTYRQLSSIVFCLSLWLSLTLSAIAQTENQQPISYNITPICTVGPNVFQVGKESHTFLTVANGNSNSTAQIQDGDTFTFTLDDTMVTAFMSDFQVLVNSSTLLPGEFRASQGTSNKQIVITYVGLAKAFPPGDSFSLKVTLAVPNAAGILGAYKVNFQGPAATER